VMEIVNIKQAIATMALIIFKPLLYAIGAAV
jgi:hypothetical protein